MGKQATRLIQMETISLSLEREIKRDPMFRFCPHTVYRENATD